MIMTEQPAWAPDKIWFHAFACSPEGEGGGGGVPWLPEKALGWAFRSMGY